VNAARQSSGSNGPLAFTTVRRKSDAGEDDVWCETGVRDGISGLYPIDDGRGERRMAGAEWDIGQPVEPGGWRNDKRATDIERYRGWRRGKSSEDQNPMGGCGVKQSHKAWVGESRREGEKPCGRMAQPR